MQTRFFLFAKNINELEKQLNVAGRSLEELSRTFDLIFWSGDGEPPIKGDPPKTAPYTAPTKSGDAQAEVIQRQAALMRGGPPDEKGHNNPWVLFDSDGNRLCPENEELVRGFAQPYEGARDDVEKLFADLREAAQKFGPEVEQIAGIEIGPDTFTVAPNWEHWCSGTGLGYSFATRPHAERLIDAQALQEDELTGDGVNILVIDQGIDKDYVNALGGVGTYGGGFGLEIGGVLVRQPGTADAPYVKTQREHGSMMVRSLLALAPEARIWDLPMIPPQIADVPTFADLATLAIFAVRSLKTCVDEPWIVVNAWGIDDRFGEDVWGDYSNNEHHALNVEYGLLGEQHDVVFAAGNSGQFYPDQEAGPYDRGPGNSILGANGHRHVTSVGAVRTDALWIGSSSQGPGPTTFSPGADRVNEKPDLCAPSYFMEPQDAGLRSGGTSAASAITAGALAALRQRWPVADVSTTEMREALRAGARRIWHSGWNGRMGAGILNLTGTMGHLPSA